MLGHQRAVACTEDDASHEASLLSHAADLDQLLSDRYADERLADEFRQRYRDARTALRRKAHRMASRRRRHS